MLSANLGEQLGATMQANFTQAFLTLCESTGIEDTSTPHPPTMINQSSTEKAMLKMIQQMQSKMDALTSQLDTANKGGSTNSTTTTNQSLRTGTPPAINPITGREYKR